MSWACRRIRGSASLVPRCAAHPASVLGWGTLLGVALFGLAIVSLAFLGSYTVHGLGTVTGAVGRVAHFQSRIR